MSMFFRGFYYNQRAHFEAVNGGYGYRSYRALIARHLLRPVNSVAHPIWHRGNRTVPPSTRGTPQRRQNTPITALSSTTLRSHHNASSSPPATA